MIGPRYSRVTAAAIPTRFPTASLSSTTSANWRKCIADVRIAAPAMKVAAGYGDCPDGRRRDRPRGRVGLAGEHRAIVRLGKVDRRTFGHDARRVDHRVTRVIVALDLREVDRLGHA